MGEVEAARDKWHALGMTIPLNMVTDKQSDKSNYFALEEPNYLSGREMPATSSKLEGVCRELNRRLVTVNHQAEKSFGRMCARFNAFFQIPIGLRSQVHIQVLLETIMQLWNFSIFDEHTSRT